MTKRLKSRSGMMNDISRHAAIYNSRKWEWELVWDPETLKGIDVSKHEPQAALYLDFKNVSHFRRYQSSHPILDAWFRFDEIRPRKENLESIVIFRQLNISVTLSQQPLTTISRTLTSNAFAQLARRKRKHEQNWNGTSIWRGLSITWFWSTNSRYPPCVWP